MPRFMWIPKYDKDHERKTSGFFGRDAYDVSVEPKNLPEGHEHLHDHEREYEHEEHRDCAGVKMIKAVLSDPPPTWAQYIDKPGGHWKIVEMEEGELQAAHAAVKAGTKSEKAVLRELSHVASACVFAINAIVKK